MKRVIIKGTREESDGFKMNHNVNEYGERYESIVF